MKYSYSLNEARARYPARFHRALDPCLAVWPPHHPPPTTDTKLHRHSIGRKCQNSSPAPQSTSTTRNRISITTIPSISCARRSQILLYEQPTKFIPQQSGIHSRCHTLPRARNGCTSLRSSLKHDQLPYVHPYNIMLYSYVHPILCI